MERCRSPLTVRVVQRPLRRSRLLLLPVFLVCPALLMQEVRAETAETTGTTSRLIELRASFSPTASKTFTEARLHRLLALELQNTAVLATSPPGPLSDRMAWVWIDLPNPTTATLEARLASGAFARRTIGIGGLGPDAAARHVTIAAAEMVRSLAYSARTRKAPPAKLPCCEQLESLSRSQPRWVWKGGLTSAFITGQPTLLAGASLSLSLRFQQTGLFLAARALGGKPDYGSVGWFEAGLGMDRRFALHPSWRLAVGASAFGASVQVGGVSALGGESGVNSSWSARAGISVGVETRLSNSMWMSLSAEPGAVLRPVSFQAADSSQGKIEGAWIGLELALHLDKGF